jgi:hypothetical protein
VPGIEAIDLQRGCIDRDIDHLLQKVETLRRIKRALTQDLPSVKSDLSPSGSSRRGRVTIKAVDHERVVVMNSEGGSGRTSNQDHGHESQHQ